MLCCNTVDLIHRSPNILQSLSLFEIGIKLVPPTLFCDQLHHQRGKRMKESELNAIYNNFCSLYFSVHQNVSSKSSKRTFPLPSFPLLYLLFSLFSLFSLLSLWHMTFSLFKHYFQSYCIPGRITRCNEPHQKKKNNNKKIAQIDGRKAFS